MEFVQYTVEDGIAIITVNRPEKLNALNSGVLEGLRLRFAEAAEQERVIGVILTGAGNKSFVAGADIGEFVGLDVDSGRQAAERGQAVFLAIERFTKPVVAAVNGFALGGGCELAMACHLRIASENASFGQPEVNLGLIPGYGGTQRLPRLVGLGRALEMILTGDRVSAARAYEIGLVNQVVPAADLLSTAASVVKTIAAKAPVAIRFALDAVYASGLSLESGLQHEARLFGKIFETEDVREGVSAFLERRKPAFKGR